MALRELGSFTGNIPANTELLDKIYDDIFEKTGRALTRRPLCHITIYGNDGDIYEVNGFRFEIKDGSWSSPTNNEGTLLEIRSLKPLQSGPVQIYYLR